MIDDSELFHGTYDPVKAKAYYERTKKLKGRRLGAGRPLGADRHLSAAPSGSGKPNRADTKSRRAELQAQKAALEKRLDHLREVLAQHVKEAKALSGKNAPKKDEKDTAPETQVDKADRNSAEKKQKLTASQKSAKAKASKKAYEKEHPTSLSTDVKVLKGQIEDIRAKIQKAIEDSRATKDKAGNVRDTKVRPKTESKPNDGPRGR